MKGVLNKEYSIARRTKQSHIYRLKRRTFEVVRGIETFHPVSPQAILDIGTAEGFMLDNLKKAFPLATCIGVEYAGDLVTCNKSKTIHLIQGDALLLPIKDNMIDIVVATAVIEHLSNPIQLMYESFRVLRKGGIFIITTPHPFWERFATSIGHLKEEEHSERITLKEIVSLFDKVGFKTMSAEHFMISPVGMPYELIIERILRLCRLNFLLLNQKIVGRKT